MSFSIRNADGSYKLMKTTSANSFTTAVAAYGKDYAYKMRAVTSKNVDAASAYSAVVGAVKQGCFCKLRHLKTAVNSNGTFTLSWGKISGAEKYEPYIKQTNGSYKLMKTTNSTSFTTAVAVYGKQYSYRMRAVRGKLVSAYSAAVNRKTQ